MTKKFYEKKFFMPIILICSLLLIIFGIVLYTATKNILENQLGLNAQGVAVTTSLMIMENIEEYKLFIETRDTESDYYKRIQHYFDYIKTKSNIKFIFIERKIDAETIEITMDSEPIGNSTYSLEGSIGINDWKHEVVYSTKSPTYFKLFTHPELGKIISAYAPLFDESNELLGIVGVSIDQTQLLRKLLQLAVVMIITFSILISFILIVLKKMSHIILDPVIKDKLTGAYNKRYFEKFIQSEIKYAKKNNLKLSILMLDLDYFKKVNDTYGHGFGDKVLQSVSMTIKELLRKSDIFVRYGGEEFIVILPNTTSDNAVTIAERIRKTIEQISIFNSEKNIDITTTISIGVAEMKNAVKNANELVDNADKALYVAKIDRNKVSVFE